jgi:hypothetical protein
MVETESLTVAEFCTAEHISLATYYKMKRGGFGPDEIRIPGTNVVRITQAARAAWQRRMQQQQHSRAARTEAARRRRQTSEAGRLAAQSPLHVQRRRRARRGGSDAR